MSALQLGLVAIGAAVVIGVFLYNKWKEREYRREMQGSFASRGEDVLMRSGSRAGPAAENPDARSDRVEPVLDMSRTGPDAGPAPAAGLSETLDFIVQMETAGEISGEAVLEAASTMPAGASSRRVRWEGFDERAGTWGPVRSEKTYSRLRAGLQLVDRRGAAAAEELAEFGTGMQDAAAELGALCSTPDTAHALAKAAELDRFCADVDIRIGVHVLRADPPFAGSAVRALADQAGLVLDEDAGVFRQRGAAGNGPCTLSNYEAPPFGGEALDATTTHGVTLELDVPRAQPGAFRAFRELVTRAARVLGGRVVDDNRRPLGEEEFGAIEAQIESVYEGMRARGIAPGGPLALRLFS